jgi:PhnB protein
MSKAKPIPKGYHTATPYLVIKGAAKAIEFYKKAFGAAEMTRMTQPDGRVGHAEMTNFQKWARGVRSRSAARR